MDQATRAGAERREGAPGGLVSGASPIEVYVERGAKRAFAGGIDWPGWARAGRDEASALDALVAYAPRYREVVGGSRPAFRPPASVAHLAVVQRLRGDATTDFGAPSIAPDADDRPVDRRDLARFLRILDRSWAALDRAADAAAGSTLRKGPRGGGRDLEAIVDQVVSAEASYVRRIAGSPPRVGERDARDAVDEERAAVRRALTRAVAEGLPERGPRGGAMWTARYFVRRAAWHVLDHAWEIEDRSGESP